MKKKKNHRFLRELPSPLLFFLSKQGWMGEEALVTSWYLGDRNLGFVG